MIDIDVPAEDPLVITPPWPHSPLSHCNWCGHEWHGLDCRFSHPHPMNPQQKKCRCEHSFGHRDDTWRPLGDGTYQTQASRLMAETGCDGYTAMACTTGVWGPGQVPPIRLRALLRGQPVATPAFMPPPRSSLA